MTFVKQLTGMAAVGVAMLVGVGLCAPEAQAGYTVTLAQVGPDVVATGSGTIDLTGLTYEYEGDSTAGLVPNEANINTGPASFEARDSYSGFTGPTSFGSGGREPLPVAVAETLSVSPSTAKISLRCQRATSPAAPCRTCRLTTTRPLPASV